MHTCTPTSTTPTPPHHQAEFIKLIHEQKQEKLMALMRQTAQVMERIGAKLAPAQPLARTDGTTDSDPHSHGDPTPARPEAYPSH